ncbi:universal stress protein UspA [Bacterioplanes sanyensis]|uniref:Universal stress protein UspA n=1 Tax=Bacterioplanes sanyensis TaxID=1249553 RepID=A0A222FPV7_9GAMM|nr:universal stress protein [Bacterioplanes sanyensis]ASP40431.1 universal stress protein UspA [Bacterioplanes sanyensis]
MLHFKHILCVIGHQFHLNSAAFRRARSLAKGQQAQLTLLQVLPDVAPLNDEDSGHLRQQACDRRRQDIQQQLSTLDGAADIDVQVGVGKRYVYTIQTVLQQGFDLVIKVAESPSWIDRWLGSDDMHLLRKCPCPVWLMRPDDKDDYHQIVAAVDLSTSDDSEVQLNDDIVQLASSVCLSDFASLDVVSVYDAPEAGFVSLWAEEPDKVQQRMLEQELLQHEIAMKALLQRLSEHLGDDAYDYLQPVPRLRQGVASQQLIEEAHATKADLLVMGTVARSGIPGVIIGNTAETVLSEVHCSVLAIKPAGFVSPVS